MLIGHRLLTAMAAIGVGVAAIAVLFQAPTGAVIALAIVAGMVWLVVAGASVKGVDKDYKWEESRSD